MGRRAAATARSACSAHQPRTRPQAPPIAESSTLSTSNCRTRRARAAPSAARTASSRWRPVARASSRLATLAQAMSRTKATAPARTKSGRADVAGQLLPQRHDARGPARIEVREHLGQASRHVRHVTLSRLGRDARLQAPGDEERPAARRPALRRESDWHPDVDVLVEKREAGRHHPGDAVGDALRDDRPAQDVRVGVVAPPPQSFADERDAAVRAALVGGEVPPDRGLHAEDVQELDRDRPRSHLLRLTAAAQRRAVDHRHRGQPVERSAHVAPVEEVGGPDDVAAVAADGVVLPDDYEPVGVGVGQALQHQRVDDAEDGGVGADADCQRQDGDDAEHGRPKQKTGAVAEILEEGSHRAPIGCPVVRSCGRAGRAVRSAGWFSD